jgi:ABC-type amino acid transport substrate-binding protein
MTDTPERRRAIAFSDPYLSIGLALLARAGPASWQDFSSKVVSTDKEDSSGHYAGREGNFRVSKIY